MMKLPDGVRRWFRLPKSMTDVNREIDEELEFHIVTRTDELVRLGHSFGRARVQALEEFGDMRQARNELGAIDSRHVQSRQRAEWWSGFAQDLRTAWRSLYRQPGLTAVIVVTLGLGLGANATTFELADRLLYRAPEHVVKAEEIQRIYFYRTNQWSGPGAFPATTYPDYAALRNNSRTMTDVAGFMGTEGTMGRGQGAQKIDLGVASASFFQLLGVRPYMGRFFTEAEDSPPHGSKVAVLTWEFWQGRMAGDRAILGKTLLLGKSEFTVIGIAPRGFSGIDLNAMDVWVPVSVMAEEFLGAEWSTSRDMSWLRPVGRLRAGASAAQAEQELTSVWRGTDSARVAMDAGARVLLGPIQEARGRGSNTDAQRSGQVAQWVAGVSLLVLLVACANVANLLLTRTIRRRRETGIRLALGVGRTRLLRLFLIESLMLSTLAAAAAVFVARLGGAILRAVLLPTADFQTSILDERLLTFIAVAAAFTTIATMAAPAIQMVHESIIPALKSGPRDGYGRSRIRSSLLFVQALLSVVLLIGAALFVRSFHNVRTMDMGFDTERLLIADIDLDVLGFKREQKRDFFLRAREQISRLGAVENAAVASSVPFYSAMSTGVKAEGVDSIPVPKSGGPFNIGVTHQYFAVTGVAILRGRGFLAQDRAGAPLVAVVNQTMAKLIWPTQDALGKCLYLDMDDESKPPCTTIVGVAEDAKKMGLDHEPIMDYYIPIEQRAGGLLALFVRAKGDPVKAAGAVQRTMQTLEPDLPYASVRPLQDLVDPQMRSWKLGAMLFTVFGVLALLLSAIGLYSMLSYAVASRTAEMGVRMALGARASDVMQLVVRDGLTVAAAGVAVGVIATLLVARKIGSLLFDVGSSDPASYAAASAALLLVATVAAVIPALRATRVDPAIALKAE